MFSCDNLFRIEEELAGYQPDIIFLDINMPHRNGLEILSSLKKTRRVKDIPVILISADGNLETIKKGLKKGAVDYVVKPFSVGRVVSAIAPHLPKV